MALHKWRLEDPADSNPATNRYVFPTNPDKMSSPFPTKAISAEATTAVDGQVLLWEGMTPATAWSFSGHVRSAEAYEELRSWVYDRRGRLFIYDHFGRRLVVVLQSFEPEGKRSVGVYWHHSYLIKALIVGAPTRPTVGTDGR